MAGEALDDADMVERGGDPVIGVVAVLAGALEVMGVVEVGVSLVFLGERDGEDTALDFDDGLEGVAVGALGGRTDILAIGVAGQAVGLLMSAIEGVDAVVDLLAEEGDGHGGDFSGCSSEGLDGIWWVIVGVMALEQGGDPAVEDVDGLAAGLIDGEDDQFSLSEEGVELSQDEFLLVLGEAV